MKHALFSVALVLATSSTALSQELELVADLNQTGLKGISGVDLGDRPNAWMVLNGKVLFAGFTLQTGKELFSVTPTGSVELIKDIRIGAKGSNPAFGAVVQGVLYFSANDGMHGNELWRTDGTAAGTTLFQDVTPGELDSNLKSWATNGQSLLIALADPKTPRLFFADPAQGPLQPVTPQFGQQGLVNPSELTALGSKYVLGAEEFFSANHEPYVTDGTLAGTIRLADIEPGVLGSNPSHFTKVGAEVYFLATRNLNQELWRTDGTPAGTHFVQTIWSVFYAAKIGPGELATNGTDLVFSAYTPSTGVELWKTDGITTTLLTDVNPPTSPLAPANLFMDGNHVYFTAHKHTHGSPAELYKATTTPFTESLLKDINPVGGSYPNRFTKAGAFIYFVANSGPEQGGPGMTGREVWRTDGTSAGTRLVGNFNLTPDDRDSGPRALFAFGMDLLFTHGDANLGRELFAVVNGVAGLHTDLEPGFKSNGSTPLQLTSVSGDQLYFSANAPFTGREPYGFKGEALQALGDLNPLPNNGSAPNQFTGLWNGTEAQVYFAATASFLNEEVYVATSSGTQLVKAIHPGANSASPRELTAFQGRMHFTAMGQDGVRELYATSGTSAGTVKLTTTSALNGGVKNLVRAGQRLFFTANNALGERVLMSTDGQAITTQLNLTAMGIPVPFGFAAMDRKLVFQAIQIVGDQPALFVLDALDGSLVEWPLPSSTHKALPFSESVAHRGRYYFVLERGNVRDLFSIDPLTGDLRTNFAGRPSAPLISQLTPAGNRVYFVAGNAVAGDLYSCTATALTGALRMKANTAGFDGVTQLHGFGDSVYFQVTNADNSDYQQELLRADATSFDLAASAAANAPPFQGTVHGSPTGLTSAGGHLYFAMTQSAGVGNEVFRLTTPEANVVDYGLPGSGGSLHVRTPKLGQSVIASGTTYVNGGTTVLRMGPPVAPYALPGVVSYDAAFLDPLNDTVIGTFANSTWSTSIQFPADPSLSGMSMALQGLTIDPAPGAPMRWTNAKLATLGL